MALLLSSFVGSGGAAATGVITDNREFKNWQDFVGNTQGSGISIPQAQRIVNGVAVDRQGQSHTFTVPDGVSKVRITCIGGGGGGGCYHSTYYGGSGGGGGCFVSGEYNVTAGQVLSVTAGDGGFGRRNQGTGGSGGTTSVTDQSTGGTLIAVSAAGGTGGQYTSTAGSGGSSHSAGGSSLVSGSTVGGHGGNGGVGSSQAFGFGPEGYGAGGGGAAGSFLGAGGQGGSGNNGGYTYSSGGGGGIGGNGGTGYGSNSTSAPNQYQDHAGAGGGSGGNGGNGTINNASFRSQGGNGRVSQPNYVGDYREQYSYNKVAGQMSQSYGSDAWMREGRGSRYGDGTSLEPALYSLSGSVGGQSGVIGNYDQDIESAPTDTEAEGIEYVGMSRTLPAKMFNGILGRLWGGGGGGAPCHDTNFGYYNHTGGEGGSGAGGGGGSGATTSWNVADNQEMKTTSFWDYSNMAFRVDESHWGVNSYRLMGHGGHGGALGGGGGSATYAYGGCGGIGAGGGGGGGHYSGGSYPSYAGHGGPGYVLIEW